MSDIVAFDNQEFGTIRTMEINGQPYWIVPEVARILGYSDTSDARRRHCKGAVKRPLLDPRGVMQQTYIIPESDLYRLIIHSKLPSAKRFEKWVFEEVLPKLRKAGSYSIKPAEDDVEVLKAEICRLREALQNQSHIEIQQPAKLAAPPSLAYSKAKGQEELRKSYISYLLTALSGMLGLTGMDMLSQAYSQMEQQGGMNLAYLQQIYMETRQVPKVTVLNAVCADQEASEMLFNILEYNMKLAIRKA